MDLAGDGQSLAASLNHSAFNVANAAGAFGGGLVIDLGFGWTRRPCWAPCWPPPDSP
jgi:DHA1 family inner membrane transport protein